MRVNYIAHLRNILPTAINGLLVAMEYDQDMIQGPPFSVEAVEIHDLFGGFDNVDTLASEDIEFRDRRVRMQIWKYQRR